MFLLLCVCVCVLSTFLFFNIQIGFTVLQNFIRKFKALYTDFSSSSLLAMQLESLFRTPHERLPSIWQSIPNTRMRWSSRTWPVLPMSSRALASSLQALGLCVDRFWDLSYYRLILLVHLDRSAWPTMRQEGQTREKGMKMPVRKVLNFTG